MNRQTRVIWAAGFIDGEGCIFINRATRRRGRKAHFLRLEASQVDLAPLRVLKELWGGTYGIHRAENENWNQAYRWRLTGVQVGVALREMLPYLVVKQQQAELGLEFRRLVHRQKGQRYGLAASELRERDVIRDAISALNGGKPRQEEGEGEKESVGLGQSEQLRLVV